MAQAGVQIQLSVAEIYKRLCPKCRKQVEEIIRDKITDQMVKQVVGE